MFERINGLPAHALLVHAAVVLVPLLVLAALAFGLVPWVRGRIWWAAALLAVVAPVAAFVAKESGEYLEQLLRSRGYPAEILDQVATHAGYGDLTFWWTSALGLVVLVHIYATGHFPRVPAPANLPGVADIALAAGSAVIAFVTAYYVYRTGDTGAKAVWTGV